MENNKKKIELHSEAVQEILGSPPRWLIRSGITVIFAVIVCLFAGSYFIKYPDILKAILPSVNSLSSSFIVISALYRSFPLASPTFSNVAV